MLQTIVTHECPRCGSVDLVKNGHDYKGDQKFHCKNCDRYGTLNAQKGYSQETRERVKQAVMERVSLRGIERIFGIARQTVSRWLRDWMAQLPPVEANLAPAQPDDVLELDECWSFVGSKKNKRWVWIAICRRTRQIVAYWVGDRSESSAIQLWRALPRDYTRCDSFSDQLAAYGNVFDTRRHQSVEKSEGETCHIERWFNTLRQRLARFTRKTLSFSKSEAMHEGLLKLFIHHYNQSESVNV